MHGMCVCVWGEENLNKYFLNVFYILILNGRDKEGKRVKKNKYPYETSL